MSLMLTSVAYLFAAIAVGVMGFAIQRGATCTVAAMDEVVNKGRFHRLTSIVEASLWVVGGLLIAQALNLLGPMPAGYPVSYFTVLGAALLGIGAYVNRACVFGAVARLGSGEWAYLITPVGFYVGCLGAEHVFPGMSAKPGYDSPVLRASSWVALGFGGLMLWRLFALLFTGAPEAAGEPWRRRWRARIELRVWSPHVATTVIGITFFFALLLVGAWAYTDVLAELAMGMKSNPVARFLLLLALHRRRDRRMDRGSVSQHADLGSAAAEMLRGRGSYGLGEPSHTRRQRRSDPRRHAAAPALCVGRVRHNVHRDRPGPAGREGADRIGSEVGHRVAGVHQAMGLRSPSSVGISSDTVGWMCIVRWSVV
jgi:hypothetical protein